MFSQLHWLQARGVPITPDTQATGVSIATWFLASSFLIMYISGQTVKYVMLRRLRLDDYLLFCATILALGISLSYSIMASNGLGNKVISIAQFDAVQKGRYAADMLYIPSVCGVKLSLLVFIRQISIDAKRTRFISTLIILTSISAVAFFIAAVFQCQVPRPWETLSLRCFDQSGFWIGFGVLDMLTDILIIVASVVLVWNVHITMPRKAIVVGCFAPRILVIAAAACRLAYLVSISPRQNPAFSLWIPVVCTEVQVCLSISTACIPSVKPLFEAVEAGVWQADNLRRRGLSLDDLHSRGYLKNSGSWIELTDNANVNDNDDINRSGDNGTGMGHLFRPTSTD
ncbi:hypothetical protein GGS26DRAFT_544163 [Hypomontagnella submonticulosa]|nr:hypothetical protein GGS26DRAFT_544163 [Hypomontagnella submonticulosa]